MEGKQNYQSLMRIEKLDTIELVIKKCSDEGLPALRRGLYAFCLERWGCEWRKFMEYLNDLVMTHRIFIDKEECWSIERWAKIKVARELDFNKMVDIIGHF